MLKQGLLLLVIVALLFLDEIVPPRPRTGATQTVARQVVANSEAPKTLKQPHHRPLLSRHNTNGTGLSGEDYR